MRNWEEDEMLRGELTIDTEVMARAVRLRC